MNFILNGSSNYCRKIENVLMECIALYIELRKSKG